MAGRIIVRSCFQPRLQGMMAKFRGSITFLVRNKSSCAKPQENRMRIGDIRGLCETHEVHEISHLFAKVCDLPEKHLVTSACSSALYWLLYSDKIEEAFEFKNLMDKYGIPKTYSTYSSLAILYAKRGRYLENMKELFNEMAKDGLSPRSRHYAPFVEAAVEEGDLLSAFDSLNEMERSAVVYERNLDLYILLIKACARSQNRKLTSKVLKIFSDFGKYRDSLSMDVLEAVKQWFDSQGRHKWTTSWSTASATFHCQVCQQKLETGEFSAAELEEFKLPLVNLLWKNNQLLPPVECFTSAGKYLDYFSQGQQNNFPKSIEHFITATGPYDIVIDGLNVAYFKGFFDPGKVEDMVVYFVRQRKRVLVLGCSPMKLLPRIQGNLQTPLDKLMDYLVNHEQCGVFCLKER